METVPVLQALTLIRRMRTDLRKEIHRLNERQTKASRVLAQLGVPAATAALEAVCAQLDFVRSLRELYSAELAAHVASYNLVSDELPHLKLTAVANASSLTQTQCLQSAAETLCAACGSCTALSWLHMWQAETWYALYGLFLTRHLLQIHGALHHPRSAQSLSPIQCHVLGIADPYRLQSNRMRFAAHMRSFCRISLLYTTLIMVNLRQLASAGASQQGGAGRSAGSVIQPEGLVEGGTAQGHC